MNNTVTVKQKTNDVRTALEAMKGQFAMVLPKHITADRLCRVAMTAIQTTPKLLDCDRTSFYSAIMKCAQLGLEPDGNLGQAYLIPFGNKVQFIPGYKGLIDLARRSGEVSNIVAKEVYENDEFTVDWSGDMPFTHKPLLSGDRGEVKFFWALARFKDGGFHWDYMTREEVEAVRDSSQGKNNDVWRKYFIEMGKKTVIRRIAKFLPMSVQRAAAFDELQDAGKNPTVTSEGDIVIDNESPAVETQETAFKSNKLDAFAGETIDQETGEVLPAFTVEGRDISTKEKLRQVADDLFKHLEAIPNDQRTSAFVVAGGSTITDAMDTKGIREENKRFVDLGIKI